jgi:hypothetical protein
VQVYSLVAQRDNKVNLKMSRISTEIAAATKKNSFAMLTIAFMSILFLPGTFLAVRQNPCNSNMVADNPQSLFFMEMFDWQASDGERVISPLFYVYWVITIPTTLAFFVLWQFWLRPRNDRKCSSQPEQSTAYISMDPPENTKVPNSAEQQSRIHGIFKRGTASKDDGKIAEEGRTDEHVDDGLTGTKVQSPPNRVDTSRGPTRW